MTARRAMEFLGGSFAVYLGVVACGSSSSDKPIASNGGETSTGGSSRGGAPSAGADHGGMGFGGIPDPTPDAGAAEAGDGPGPTMCDCPEPPDPYVPPEPLVVEAECDVRTGSNSSGLVFAQIEKPDLPDAKLWLGKAVLIGYDAGGSWVPPGGHDTLSQHIMISADHVAAPCGSYGSGTPALPTSVWFIFPR